MATPGGQFVCRRQDVTATFLAPPDLQVTPGTCQLLWAAGSGGG